MDTKTVGMSRSNLS